MANKITSPWHWAQLAFKTKTPSPSSPSICCSVLSRSFSTSPQPRSIASQSPKLITSPPTNQSPLAAPQPRTQLQQSLATARLRARYASTQPSSPVPASVGTNTSGSAGPEAKPTLTEIKQGEELGVEPQKADKINVGEVRRLASLARPEVKTIGIAIGLVSLITFST